MYQLVYLTIFPTRYNIMLLCIDKISGTISKVLRRCTFSTCVTPVDLASQTPRTGNLYFVARYDIHLTIRWKISTHTGSSSRRNTQAPSVRAGSLFHYILERCKLCGYYGFKTTTQTLHSNAVLAMSRTNVHKETNYGAAPTILYSCNWYVFVLFCWK